nr:immunoglobulin light chain junction region [Macaca mulatta]MOX33782.1 immunoglobulin light chain junction region [Macaca mulatta]MOX34341.1 immunoglobulin light chain junction region [Macaca mulatta]MOX35206.1 immunoglobulin light chain junction region [Macaca mulatta]
DYHCYSTDSSDDHGLF